MPAMRQPGNAADREALDGALKKGLRLLRALRHDRFPFVRVVRAAAERVRAVEAAMETILSFIRLCGRLLREGWNLDWTNLRFCPRR